MRAPLTEEKVPERCPWSASRSESRTVRNHKDPYRHGYRDQLPGRDGFQLRVHRVRQ